MMQIYKSNKYRSVIRRISHNPRNDRKNKKRQVSFFADAADASDLGLPFLPIPL